MQNTRASKSVKRAPRVLAPKPALVVAPAMVTQLTCFVVLGLNDSRYLGYLSAHPAFPQWRVGQLVCTNVADWQRAAAPLDASTPAPVDVGDDQPENVDDVLALLGKRRTA